MGKRARNAEAETRHIRHCEDVFYALEHGIKECRTTIGDIRKTLDQALDYVSRVPQYDPSSQEHPDFEVALLNLRNELQTLENYKTQLVENLPITLRGFVAHNTNFATFNFRVGDKHICFTQQLTQRTHGVTTFQITEGCACWWHTGKFYQMRPFGVSWETFWARFIKMKTFYLHDTTRQNLESVMPASSISIVISYLHYSCLELPDLLHNYLGYTVQKNNYHLADYDILVNVVLHFSCL